MKISIAVPVYGVEKFIERCARSLFEQTYSDIEYVFVDDCTPDRSIDVLLQVVEEYPDRKDAIRIIHNETNKGLSATRRIAISNCTGDFVYNIDSDDYIEPTTISDLIEKQKGTNADIVAAHMYINDCQVDQNLITPDYHSAYDMLIELLSKDTHHELCGRMVRRSLFSHEDIWTPDGLNVGEDWVMTSKLAYYAKKVVLVDKHLYHYIQTNEASYMHDVRTQRYTAILRNINILFVVRVFFIEHKENELTKIINNYIVKLLRIAIALSLEKQDKLNYQKALMSSKRLNAEDEMKIWGNSLVKIAMQYYPLAVTLYIIKKTIM
jgi:glycosyltransferase involved in cell wall biosynthesis